MKVTFLLADAAQVDDRGKVHAIGLGWTNIPTTTPPIALVLIIDAEADEVPNPMGAKIELLDLDNNPVVVRHNPGSERETIQIVASGHIAPQSPEQSGEPIRRPVVVQIGPGIELSPGLYKFRAVVNLGADAKETAEQIFSVRGVG